MASINFLEGHYQPCITCSKPSLDGYDISNLIAVKEVDRQKGFMGESFVKPPIDIALRFPCNIDIHKVVIGCKVGSYGTSGLEIFTHSSKWEEGNCWLLRDVSPSIKSPQQDDKIFTSVGKGFNNEHSVFSFVNRRFNSRYPFRTWPKAASKNAQQHGFKVNIRHHDIWHLNNVSHLSIRILKTKSYICALKFIEVWGQPSLECSKHKELVALLQSIHKSLSVPLQPLPQPSQPQPVKRKTSTDEIRDEDIPAEFIDPLTNDLMRIPLLLPCGQSIDQSSLDRYSEQEAKYGRPPNDPFTGNPFSSTTKPVPNAALKVRIDHFLMHNVSKTQLAVVGSSNQHCEHVSSLVTANNPPPTHDKAPQLTVTSRPKKQIRLDTNRSGTPPVPSGGAAQDIPGCHSSNLKSSLDAALFSALGETQESRTVDLSANTKTNCAKCKATSGLYKLNCSHILCRKCLLEIKKKEDQCPTCNVVLIHRDIVKVHN